MCSTSPYRVAASGSRLRSITSRSSDVSGISRALRSDALSARPASPAMERTSRWMAVGRRLRVVKLQRRARTASSSRWASVSEAPVPRSPKRSSIRFLARWARITYEPAPGRRVDARTKSAAVPKRCDPRRARTPSQRRRARDVSRAGDDEPVASHAPPATLPAQADGRGSPRPDDGRSGAEAFLVIAGPSSIRVGRAGCRNLSACPRRPAPQAGARAIGAGRGESRRRRSSRHLRRIRSRCSSRRRLVRPKLSRRGASVATPDATCLIRLAEAGAARG